MTKMEKTQRIMKVMIKRPQLDCRPQKLGITWDAASLDKSLANPRAMVPDTSMVYAGLKDDAERADLVAYLETLH